MVPQQQQQQPLADSEQEQKSNSMLWVRRGLFLFSIAILLTAYIFHFLEKHIWNSAMGWTAFAILVSSLIDLDSITEFSAGNLKLTRKIKEAKAINKGMRALALSFLKYKNTPLRWGSTGSGTMDDASVQEMTEILRQMGVSEVKIKKAFSELKNESQDHKSTDK